MKHLAVLCSLLFAGCVMDVEGADQTADTEQSELQTGPVVSPVPSPVLMVDATKSVPYSSSTVTADSIWPTNRNISNVEVVYMAAPPNGRVTQFLTFVVWNGSLVAHIYTSPTGAVGASLQSLISNTLAERVTYGTDTAAIITGSGSGGTPIPVPHPNVDNQFTFNADFLSVVKSQAVTALHAEYPVFQIPTTPIYEPGG